jgi:hypothetical protein
MSEFSTEQIKHIQRLSTFLSTYFKWKYTSNKKSIQLTIQTDDWLMLRIRITPQKIDKNWEMTNYPFHYLIGWFMVSLFKSEHHISLEKNVITYLSKAFTLTNSSKTIDQSEPFV